MDFSYDPSSGWTLNGQTTMSGGGFAESGTGESHPDIAIDQKTGDLYLAWTLYALGKVDICYARHEYGENDSTWEFGAPPNQWVLEDSAHDPWGANDGWFVNLDVGDVAGLNPNDPDEVTRVVGFAYTGLFPEGSQDDLWGCRPLVGWWDISDGPDDGSHQANALLITPGCDPGDESGKKYDAGLIHVDIPRDNATDHGAAVTYVQDTCDPEVGTYQVYGISSLYYSSQSSYVWINGPGSEEFEQATWPSLAIHNDTGDTASVTYFGMITGSTWETYATQWDLVDGSLLDPIDVDTGAHGYFSLDVLNFMKHNWGTSSSLVDLDGNIYWAAWSDTVGDAEPHEVHGAIGYTE
jgi:hypothetical protein